MKKLEQFICGLWFDHDWIYGEKSFCKNCGTRNNQETKVCLEIWLEKIWQKLNPVRVNGKISKIVFNVPSYYFYQSENGYELEKMR